MGKLHLILKFIDINMWLPKFELFISLFLATTLLVFESSCQPILRATIGMHSSKYLSQSEIEEYARIYHIDSDNLYILDEVKYLAFVDEYTKVSGKNYFEENFLTNPLLVMGFDQTGSNQFFMRSCDAGGFPNLKWNRYGYFDHHPLLMNPLYLPDTLYGLDSFQTYVQFYKPLNPSTGFVDSSCKEILVVHWNNIMGRQTKRLLKTVNIYIEVNCDNICVLYVNTDNLYARTKKQFH